MGFSLGEGHGGDMAPLDHLSTRRVRHVDMGFRGHGGLRDMGGELGTWSLGYGDMATWSLRTWLSPFKCGGMAT